MRINAGRSLLEIRRELMQEALNKMQQKYAPNLPELAGVAATDLQVGAGLYPAGAKANWSQYEIDMLAATTGKQLRDVHGAFLTLEGL